MNVIEQIEDKSFFIMEFFDRAEEKTTNKKLLNELFASEVITLDALLKILEGYDIKPRLEDWEEGVAEAFSKMHDEINRQLKFHGKFEDDDIIMIDKKQNKFIVIERKKLQELKDFLLKNNFITDVEDHEDVVVLFAKIWDFIHELFDSK